MDIELLLSTLVIKKTRPPLSKYINNETKEFLAQGKNFWNRTSQKCFARIDGSYKNYDLATLASRDVNMSQVLIAWGSPMVR